MTSKHVMLSYQWDCQDLVSKVYDLLTEQGLKCWMDIKGGMTANINEAMAEGVENAIVIVPFLSKAYQNSRNCSKELSYADQRGIEIVPVMIDKDFTASGWLGITTAGLLWQDFRGTEAKDKLTEKITGLNREIKKRISEVMASDSESVVEDTPSEATYTKTVPEKPASQPPPAPVKKKVEPKKPAPVPEAPKLVGYTTFAEFANKTLESFHMAAPTVVAETFVFESMPDGKFATNGTGSGRNEFTLDAGRQVLTNIKYPQVTCHLENKEFRWSHGYGSRLYGTGKKGTVQSAKTFEAFVDKNMESYHLGSKHTIAENFKFVRAAGGKFATVGTKSGRNEYTLDVQAQKLIHVQHKHVTCQLAGNEFVWSHGYGSREAKGTPAAKKSQKNLNAELNATARNTNDTKKIEALVKQGAKLLSTNGAPWHHTPLHQASYHGRTESAKMLVKLLTDRNILEENLKMKSNPCGRGSNGFPLELATGGKHTAVVAILKQAGAAGTTSNTTKSTGKTAKNTSKTAKNTVKLNGDLNNAARNTNDTAKIKSLVLQGADLLSTNGHPWNHTPLHQAAYHGRTESAKVLVSLLKEKQLYQKNMEMKSNPCGRGKNGFPIELARGGGHRAIVTLLGGSMPPKPQKSKGCIIV